MAFDPKQCRVLLVGKLLARLEPFLKSKGYARTEAEESGLKSVDLLGSGSYHLVLLEVNLRDIELRDFFQEARAKQRDASFILMAPPNEAEMVVSALVLGADAYVPLPPDEEELFQVLERHGVAAMQRKSGNPDAQPGMSEKTKKLEAELADARAQLADLEEQNRLFEAETERLKKVAEAAQKDAEAAKKEAAKKSSADVQVPPGHKVVSIAAFEELEGKATFIEFLESENDEIKRERDSLLEKLKESGLADDLAGGGADFDEPTGAVHIDDESLMRGVPAASKSDDIMFANDDDDDDNVNIDDSAAGGDGGDDDDMLIVEDDSEEDGEEESEEFDLAALEEIVAKRPAPAPKAAPVPKAAAASAAVKRPAPMPLAKAVPPPTADNDDDSGDGDDFEDVNTDALLRLAEEASSSDGPSAADLEELLAAIDDD